MAGDGPLAPPPMSHRTNGDELQGRCTPDDCRCTDGVTRGWLMAYPSADPRIVLRACLHKYDCPAHRCLKETEEAQRVLVRVIQRRRAQRAAA